MYTKKDKSRFNKEVDFNPELEYRTTFRRDLARIIHSHSFRRLTGKTQLFPNYESDFFRNRLTHSLEVAQISKSIAIKINNQIESKVKELNRNNELSEKLDATSMKLDLDLIELAGLAHDIGHPPFGHQGEEILAEKMKDHGGFEGNAQTLRILSKIEKKIIHENGLLANAGFSKGVKDETGKYIDKVDLRGGLNLTYRSLASILKYDVNISSRIAELTSTDELKEKYHKDRDRYVFKGYYDEERVLVEKIKKHVAGNPKMTDFKTIECQIMDLADDITYSTYDLEDAFKAGFISPIEIFAQDKKFFEQIKNEVNEFIDENDRSDLEHIDEYDIKDIISDLFKPVFKFPEEVRKMKSRDQIDTSSIDYSFLKNQYTTRYNDLMTKNGYVRGNFSSQLIAKTIRAINFEFDLERPAFSKIYLDPSALIRVAVLKTISFKTQILSPRLQAQEHRGKRIVKEIFEFLQPIKDNDKAPALLPDDYKLIYEQKPGDEQHQYRTICDYIACMTDRYAIEFHGRIKSENPSSIFKTF